MSTPDWTAVMLGSVIGLVVGVLFFLGLAFGMRRALLSESPIMMLTLSAAFRIAVLIGVGWVVLGQGGPWAGVGYALAFFLTRFFATTFARAGLRAEGSP